VNDPGWPKLPLSEAEDGGVYEVVSVRGPAARRLEELGLVRGAAVRVESAGFCGVVVEAMGSRVALSEEAAADVTVAWKPDTRGETRGKPPAQ